MSGDRRILGVLGAVLGLGIGILGVRHYFLSGSLELKPAVPAQARSAGTASGDRALLRATEALDLSRATVALQALEGIEDSLPQLTDHVLMLRAIAYELASSPVSAQSTWEQLLDNHPNSPAVPRALLGLGRTDELRSRFSEHPVTIDYLEYAIGQSPQHVEIVRHLAAVAPASEGLTPHLTRWLEAHRGNLTAADYQIAADAYWAQKEYGKASRAYQSAPQLPQNLYRLGRAHQISRENSAAIAAYQQLLSQFPDAEEVGDARLHMAEIVTASKAIILLRQEAERGSARSPAALSQLSRLYARVGNRAAAEASRQELWQTYPRSSEAGQLASEVSSQRANAGNISGAIALARQIGTQQPSTEWGAKLNFWAGKWMSRQGNSQEAASVYRQVLQQARSSYYGWRAAALLGLPAGDFNSGRMPVTLQYQPAILQLPDTSAAVQRLHSIGVADAAWQRWQWENYDRPENSQSLFVRGVLQNRGSDYLDRLQGINTVASLIQQAEEGDEIARQLQNRADFWQTVYPLHHYDTLVAEAESFGLNPLVMAGLIRQESRFEPQIVSRSGALGLTQVMPATGAWIAGKVGRPSYNLKTPNDNLHFGAWYLDYTHRTYQNNSMLAIASYNAGPGNVAQWTQRYSLADRDAFVEQIPFPETRNYVKAVLGNYWNYLQIYAPNTNNLDVELQELVSKSS